MQKVKLPHSVEPTKSAMKRSDYRGVIASKDMERLSEAVVRCNDYVDAEVQFEKRRAGSYCLSRPFSHAGNTYLSKV